MKNITTEIKDGKLHVTMELAQDFGPSKTGKTTIIASSEGNQKLSTPSGDVVLGLNLYKKR